MPDDIDHKLSKVKDIQITNPLIYILIIHVVIVMDTVQVEMCQTKNNLIVIKIYRFLCHVRGYFLVT